MCGVDDERRCDGADAIADMLCAACARADGAKRAGRSALFSDGEVDNGLAAAAADTRAAGARRRMSSRGTELYNETIHLNERVLWRCVVV